MSWDPVWERIFRERSWGRYPPEEVVRFIARNFGGVADRGAVRILELGCGPGAGTSWFIAREGFSYAGIDASATAIEKTRLRFEAEGLAGDIVVGDIAELPWGEGAFDCVVDIACLTCNTEGDTQAMLAEVHRVLKPGGCHFSMSFRDGCWGQGAGRQLDATTWCDITEGPFAGLGNTRFATRQSLLNLYADFSALALDYVHRSVDDGAHEIRQWLLSCRK